MSHPEAQAVWFCPHGNAYAFRCAKGCEEGVKLNDFKVLDESPMWDYDENDPGTITCY
jgi:hypothetical protein